MTACGRRAARRARIVAGSYALGYFTPRITIPGTCLIYG